MTNELARWQFATTSIYHFLFVPVTIGLAFLVAILQTAWHRTDNTEYRRLTRFFGVLLLINVAVGVVTGLVQEFEFGMNWSSYSRYVGDVFGGPLAMEGLAAFFLESTFLGLWIFGWDRLPRRVHLATIWLVSIGTMLSAMFILAANSWMQHPVGYRLNSKGMPELNDIGAIFTNPTFLWGYVHVLIAAFITGAMVMLAVSAWQILKGRQTATFVHSAKLSVIVLLPVILLQMFVGNKLGEIETKYQPMKIAAAEAQWENCRPCSFSAFQIGGGKNDHTPSQIIEIPHLLSFLATGTFDGGVTGLTQLQREEELRHGPGEYVPNVFVQYWSMRVMAYLATLVMVFALWGAWLLHTGRLAQSRWFLRLGIWGVVTPFLMNTAGWLLTENGRQPWIVQGLMKTADANSPSVTSTDIWISLAVLVLVYVALGAADVVLMTRYARRELPAVEESSGDGSPPTSAPALSY